jgi:hypothetical protein
LPLKRLFGKQTLQPPGLLSSREVKDYGSHKLNGGYTIFCVATSVSE